MFVLDCALEYCDDNNIIAAEIISLIFMFTSFKFRIVYQVVQTFHRWNKISEKEVSDSENTISYKERSTMKYEIFCTRCSYA